MVVIPSTSFYYTKVGAPFQEGFEKLISGLNRRYELLKYADNVLLSGTEVDVEIPESSWFDYSNEFTYRNPPPSAEPQGNRRTYAIYDPRTQYGNPPDAAVSPDFKETYKYYSDFEEIWTYIDYGFYRRSRYYEDRPALEAYLNLFSLDVPDDDTYYPSGLSVYYLTHPYQVFQERLKDVPNAPTGLTINYGVSGCIWPLDLDGYDMYAGLLRYMSCMSITQTFWSTYNYQGLSAVYDHYLYRTRFYTDTGTIGSTTKTHTVEASNYNNPTFYAMRAYTGYYSAGYIDIHIKIFKEFRSTNPWPERMLPYCGYGLWHAPSYNTWRQNASQADKDIYDDIVNSNTDYEWSEGVMYESKLSLTKEDGYYRWNAVNINEKINLDVDGLAADMLSKDIVVTSYYVDDDTHWKWETKLGTDISYLLFGWKSDSPSYNYGLILHLDFKDYLRL